MRLAASFLVALVTSLITFITLNDFGIAWDEPIHFRNADAMVAWVKNPKFSDKDNFFKAAEDDVHPPLRKLLAGMTHEILTNKLQIIDNTRGYRISTLLFVLPFVTVYTYVAIGYVGFPIGIMTALMYSLLPHVLYLTPLVTMDYAIAALWFLATLFAVKSRFVLSGIMVGFTMLTKLHGFLLFIPMLILRLTMKQYLIIFFTAFLTYGIGWPWLWTSTLSHLTQYFGIQTAHGSVPVLLFGKIYEFAPWWYTPIMFLTTTPLFVLIFFVIGTYFVIRKGKLRDRIFLINALYPIIFFSLPGVYRYDWVRLFLPAFPFVCLVAARGIKIISKRIHFSFIAILWLVTVYISVIRIHPWESSYYNELIGGINGARKLGMETEFWGNAYKGVLPWMNEHAADPQCVTPTTHPFYYYQAMGQLDAGVIYRAPKEECVYVIVLMRQGLFNRDPFIANVVRSKHPVYTVSVDGVPLVGVYKL